MVLGCCAVVQVLLCAWEGLQQPSLSEAGKRDASQAIADVLTFTLTGAEKYAPDDVDAYLEEIMQTVVRGLLVPAALIESLPSSGGSNCCAFAALTLSQVRPAASSCAFFSSSRPPSEVFVTLEGPVATAPHIGRRELCFQGQWKQRCRALPCAFPASHGQQRCVFSGGDREGRGAATAVDRGAATCWRPRPRHQLVMQGPQSSAFSFSYPLGMLSGSGLRSASSCCCPKLVV